MYESLILERDEHIAVVTLNRPETLNALNPQLRDEMQSECEELRDDDELRVAIWAGAGAMNFCATSTRDTLATTRFGTITRPAASAWMPGSR